MGVSTCILIVAVEISKSGSELMSAIECMHNACIQLHSSTLHRERSQKHICLPSPVTNPRGINFFAVSTLNLNGSDAGLFFLTVNYTNPTDPNSLKTVLQLRTNNIANFKCMFNDYHMLV